MRVLKFNESLDPENVSSKELEEVLDDIIKYQSYLGVAGKELAEDIKKLKSGNWSLLRKWKVKNIISRFNTCKSMIEEIDRLEDFLVEIEDEGWKYTHDYQNKRLSFIATEHAIPKLASLFSFLSHTHRLGFTLLNTNYTQGNKTARVEVKYKFRVSLEEPHELTTDEKIRKLSEEE